MLLVKRSYWNKRDGRVGGPSSNMTELRRDAETQEDPQEEGHVTSEVRRQ